MNQIQFLRRAKSLFNDFKFEVSSVGSIHGTKHVPFRAFRDAKDNSLINLRGIRQIFISGQMYPNTDKDFIYCTIYTLANRRGYHCKNWCEHEPNKLFISAKNYELLYEKLKEQVSEINN